MSWLWTAAQGILGRFCVLIRGSLSILWYDACYSIVSFSFVMRVLLMFACTWVQVQVHVYAWACGGQRDIPGLFSAFPLFFFFETWLSLIRSSLIQLVWLASEPQVSACLPLPNTGYRSAVLCPALITSAPGRNSGSCAYVTDTLPLSHPHSSRVWAFQTFPGGETW